MENRLLLHRIDPRQNMARFYALSIEPTLFGGHAVVRRWGRIGTAGRLMIHLHDSKCEAQAVLGKLVAAKCKRGYEFVRERCKA